MGLLSHGGATVMGQRSRHWQENLMHVFVTGGTGLVGSAVTAELVGNGHTVLALVRSDASEQAAVQAGAETIRGTLADLDILRAGVAKADGVIHLAFSNDFSSAEAVLASV